MSKPRNDSIFSGYINFQNTRYVTKVGVYIIRSAHLPRGSMQPKEILAGAAWVIKSPIKFDVAYEYTAFEVSRQEAIKVIESIINKLNKPIKR